MPKAVAIVSHLMLVRMLVCGFLCVCIFFLRVMAVYMPTCMDRQASMLYSGPVGSAPGKRIRRALVFSRHMAMLDMGLIIRRAMIIGISQIW